MTPVFRTELAELRQRDATLKVVQCSVMGPVTASSGCVAAVAVCASAWRLGAIPASAEMQDASAPQHQARLIAGTKRIAILYSTFTSPLLRSVDHCWRIAAHYRHRFTFLPPPVGSRRFL
jgi:hypothetical protein